MKILLTALFLISFNSFAQSVEQTRDRLAIDVLAKSTHALSKLDLRCSDKSDCMIFPMGTRSCGGPSSYVVTSKDHKYLNDIEELANKVTDKEKEYNERYRVISICTVLMPPNVECHDNKCTR